MKICATAIERRKSLAKILPHSVAVAYVGHAWDQYVDRKALRSIIISTSLGSNPYAIERIMNVVGPENVYFLDSLHSKIYIGDSGALIGSSNLSKNGFSDRGNHEICALLESSASVNKISSLYEKYLLEAKRQYPNVESRKDVLVKMFESWQAVTSAGVKLPDADVDEIYIEDFISSLPRIHIAYWSEDGAEFNKRAIIDANPQLRPEDVDEFFSESLQFLEDDPIEVGDWVLCWRNRADGCPRKNSPIEWMYVGCVIPKGFDDEKYTKLVGTVNGSVIPPSPFKISKEVASRVRAQLASGRYPEMLAPQRNEIWHLQDADARVSEFLAELAKGPNHSLQARRP